MKGHKHWIKYDKDCVYEMTISFFKYIDSTFFSVLCFYYMAMFLTILQLQYTYKENVWLFVGITYGICIYITYTKNHMHLSIFPKWRRRKMIWQFLLVIFIKF